MAATIITFGKYVPVPSQSIFHTPTTLWGCTIDTMASNQLALALAYTLSTAWRRWLLPGLTHVRAAVFGLVYKLYVSPIGAVVTRLSEGKPPHTANKGGVAVAQQLDLGSGVVVRIVAVPVLDDNYSYLIIDVAERTAVAVDPADPEAVLKAARTEGVVLKAILTTHHHWYCGLLVNAHPLCSGTTAEATSACRPRSQDWQCTAVPW